jgi:hypothetical protein
MKTGKDKDLTEEEKDIKAEVEGAVGEKLEEDELLAKYAGNPGAYASPPTMRGATSFNRSISPFSSVSLSKAGIPCAPKSAKGDKPPEWEEGEVSEETVHDEPAGEYNPPRKKKSVKKSLFSTVSLNKAQDRDEVESDLERTKEPDLERTKEPDLEKDTGKETDVYPPVSEWKTKGLPHPIPSSPKAPPSKEGPPSLKSKGLPHLIPSPPAAPPSKEGPSSLKSKGVKTPAGFSASLTRKSLTERRYGAQSTRLYDIGKSCGVCGKISKSCGDHKGGGCCEDCKKSMSTTSWHKSHLS